MKVISATCCILVLVVTYSSVFAATFVVGSNLNLSDQNPGDGVCQTASPHECSLKAALEEANAHTGGPDTITFAAALTFSSSTVPLPAITATGLTIDGSSQWNTTTDSPGIEISAGGGDSGLVINGSNTLINGIFFSGDGNGIHVDRGSTTVIGGPGLHERNVFIATSGGKGIFIDQNSYATTVHHNYFGTRNGESYVPDDVYYGGTGIHIFGSRVDSTTIIENNVIGEHRTGILLDGTGTVKVRHNLIGVFGGTGGARIPNEIGIELMSTNAEIENNTIDYNTQGQIYSAGGIYSGSPVIRANTIGSFFTDNSMQQGDGIKLEPVAGQIIGNKIENMDGNGILIDVGSATIESNLIFNNNGNGMYLSTSIGTTVSSNTIFNNTENGILLRATQDTVVNKNTIGFDNFLDGGNGLSGIRLENGATGNLIGGPSLDDANRIGFNSASGIYITDAGTRDNYVAGNILGSTERGLNGYLKAGNKNHGIAVYNNAESNNIGLSGSLISGNIILDSIWRGIAVINANYTNIVGNNVGTEGASRNWGNGYSGVQVIGTNNTVKYNTVAYNGTTPEPDQAGIIVEGAGSFNNHITENSIYSNGAEGIDLRDGANANVLPPVLSRNESYHRIFQR